MNIPVRTTKCATCPFREGSKYAFLANELMVSATTEASRICHSTGSNNAINKRTGKEPHLCRGARDIQLKLMSKIGIISEASDEAWNNARELIGMDRIETKDP